MNRRDFIGKANKERKAKMLNKSATTGLPTLNRRGAIEIYEFMKPLLSKGEDDYWDYQAGWDDETVCKHFTSKYKVSRPQIKRIRQENFGLIRPFMKDPSSRLKERIEALEQRLSRIEKELGL